MDSAAPSLTHHILVWQPTCSQSSPSLHEACGEHFLCGTGHAKSCTYGCWHSSETAFCTGVLHRTRWEHCILTAGLKLLSDVFYSLGMLPRPGKLYSLGNTGSNFPKLNPPKLSWNKWKIQRHSISENATLSEIQLGCLKISPWNFAHSPMFPSLLTCKTEASGLSLPQTCLFIHSQATKKESNLSSISSCGKHSDEA